MRRCAWLLVLLVACGKGKGNTPAKGSASQGSAATSSTAKLGRAIDVSVSQSHVCAVLASGQVACWGELDSVLAPLGTRPTLIEGVTDATAVAEDCVLRGKKPAMCWDNQRVAKEVPGTENARQIVHGEWTPCFLLANGNVSCFDDRAERLEPVAGLTGVRAIDDRAYSEWCYVRDKDGAIVCTGDHDTDLGKQLPVVPDAIGVSRIDQSMACVHRPGGALQCFGTYEDALAKLPKTGDQLFLEGMLACVRNGGAISCRPWAEDTWLARALPGGAKATDLSCDSNVCCAVLSDGAIGCWGNNGEGRLGDGMPAYSRTPVKVDKLPPVEKLLAGEHFTVAVTREDHDVYAWGNAGKGPHVPEKLASGVMTVATSSSFVMLQTEYSVRVMVPDREKWDSESLPAPPAKARSLAIDDSENMCAALADKMTYCLRPDAAGNEYRWMPIRGMSNAKELSGGGPLVCGVSEEGSVSCMVDERSIDEEKAPPRNATTLPGIRNARHVSIPYVELADGTVTRLDIDEKLKWSTTPQPALAGMNGITTGGYAWSPSCAIKEKRAHCWYGFGGGEDRMGVLGRGDASKIPTGTPAPVEGAIDAFAVATGNKHACLVDTSGAVWCWGDDRWGALGRGRVTWRDEPARVVDIGP
jgi:hypothetical protein